MCLKGSRLAYLQYTVKMMSHCQFPCHVLELDDYFQWLISVVDIERLHMIL